MRRWRVSSHGSPLPFARVAAGSQILDAPVAATAIVEQIPVVSRDIDYGAIPGVEVIRV